MINATCTPRRPSRKQRLKSSNPPVRKRSTPASAPASPPPPKRTTLPPSPKPVVNEEYVVEKILEEKVENGVKKFRVKWAGYDMDEASWEPRESFECENGVNPVYTAWITAHPPSPKKKKRRPGPNKKAKSAFDDPAVKAALAAMQERFDKTFGRMEGMMNRMLRAQDARSSSGSNIVINNSVNVTAPAKAELKSFSHLPKNTSKYRVWRSVESQWVKNMRPAINADPEIDWEAPANWLEMTEAQVREAFPILCESPRLLKKLPASNNCPARPKGGLLRSDGIRRLMQNFLQTWASAMTGRASLVDCPKLKDVRCMAINKLALEEPLRLPVRTFTPAECKKLWAHMTQEPVSVRNVQRLMFYLVHVFLGLRTGRSIYSIDATHFHYSPERDTIYFRGVTTKTKLAEGQSVKERMYRNSISPQTKALNHLFEAYCRLRARAKPTRKEFFLHIKANADVPILTALKENLEVFADSPVTRAYQSSWLRTLAEEAGVSSRDIQGRTLRCMHALAQTKAGLAHTWTSDAINHYLREHSALGEEYMAAVSGGGAGAGGVEGSDLGK
jgi:hypothetical protein